MRKLLLVVILCWLVLPAGSATYSSSAADREAVRQAVLDYVEGVYNVDPTRIERGVHPNLSKIGFYRPEDEASFRRASTMTFEQLKELAANFNKDGRVPADAPKEIEIYDVLDQIASAKLTAYWGIDYMPLAKFDGRWQIINVLWQSPPQ